jgi:hypothetical protein
MAEDIKAAVAECTKATEAAALPLTFTAEARQIAVDRTLAQFTMNLVTAGGWKAAGPAMLKAATLFGASAKAIALFHDDKATVIGVDDMAAARELVEDQCRFGLARRMKKHPAAVTTRDGLVCGH